MQNTVSELTMMDTLSLKDTDYIKTVIHTKSSKGLRPKGIKDKIAKSILITLFIIPILFFIYKYLSLIKERRHLLTSNQSLIDEIDNKNRAINQLSEKVKNYVKESEDLEKRHRT